MTPTKTLIGAVYDTRVSPKFGKQTLDAIRSFEPRSAAAASRSVRRLVLELLANGVDPALVSKWVLSVNADTHDVADAMRALCVCSEPQDVVFLFRRLTPTDKRTAGERRLRAAYLPTKTRLSDVRAAADAIEAVPSPMAAKSPLLLKVESEVGYALEVWPVHQRNAAMAARVGFTAAKHDSGASRLGMALFLLHNGATPLTFARWVNDRGCCPTALNEFACLLRELASGKSEKTTWDLGKRRVVSAVLPPGAEIQEAVALLRRRSKSHSSGSAPGGVLGAAEYYKNVFPFADVLRLLHRPELDAPVQLREIAIDSKVLRCRPMESLEKLQWTLQKVNGVGLHVGPMYRSLSGDDGPGRAPITEPGEPLRTELCLEVDELPSGVPEQMRWEWMRHAVLVLRTVLGWHGVQSLFGFCSGNRGPHLWVRDAWVLKTTTEQRAELVQAVTTPWDHANWPLLVERLLLPFYTRHFTGLPGEPQLRTLTCPQVDVAVAFKCAGHLHRLPFSIHEKSHRLALPFDVNSQDLEGFPTGPDDIPKLDDPRRGVQVASALRWLRAARGGAGDVHASIQAPAAHQTKRHGASAPWEGRQPSKRPRHSHSEALAPFRLDVCRSIAFLELLEGSAASLTPPTDSRVRSITDRATQRGKDWRKRLRLEISKLRRIFDVYAVSPPRSGATGTRDIRGQPYTNGSGRTHIYYPELDASDYLGTLAPVTRHELGGGNYVELDISAAHMTVCWAAVVIAHGAERAQILAPCLGEIVADKHRARETVAREGPGRDAKVAIAAVLNQDRRDSGGETFLARFARERGVILDAVRRHPLVVPLLRSAAQQPGWGNVSELAHLMQHLEAAALRAAVLVLNENHIETGLLLNDGLLARRCSALTAPGAAAQVLAAVNAKATATLGARVVFELK